MKVITIPQLRKWQAEGERFLLVNVMNEDDFQRNHIPGSVNIPSGDHDFTERIAQQTAHRGAPVVVYCSNNNSAASPQAGMRLEHEGFSNVYNLRAGIEGWAAEGLPVERTPVGHGLVR
jgi:rhodanese-related sulfurtransferase